MPLHYKHTHPGSKKCSRCDYSTNRSGHLNFHEKGCLQSDEIFKCEKCGYRSGTQYGLAVHWKREHPGMKRKKKNLKIGTKKCSRCDYR